MKKIILSLGFSLISLFSFSQLINENFSSGLPTGWTTTFLSDTSWVFDNPGGRTITGTGFDANFAIIDSDNQGGGNTQQSFLTTSSFSTVGMNVVTLKFSESYRVCCGSTGDVKVSVNGGSTYTSVLSRSTSSVGYPNPATVTTVDLSTIASNQANVMIQWEYNGTWDYWWAIDSVVVEVSAVSCAIPSGLGTSGLTSNSVNLDWTENGTATSWQIEWGVSGFTQGSGTKFVTGTNPHSLTGLTANTNYDWYVRAICAPTDTSSWSSSNSFFTGYCTPAPASTDGSGITNVTFSTVNNTGPTSGGTEPGYGDYSAMVGDIAQNTTVNVDITYSTGYTYVTEIWIDWNDDLDFDDAGENVYSGVSLSTNPTTLSASFAVALTAPLGQHRMRIGGADTGPPTTCYTGSWASYEDYTVNVTAPPSCFAPTANAASSITSSSADLNWTENGTATSWQVEWDANGFTPGTGNKLVTSSNPYNLSGLTDNTAYQFRVRAICAPTDTSVWSSMISFTTLCATFSAPFTMDFEASTTSTPSCWSQSGAESWLFRNTGTGHIGNAGTISGSTASGGYFAWVDDSSPHNTATTLESPFVDVSGLTTPRLTFYTLSNDEGDASGNVDFHVDVYDGAAWNDSIFFSDTNSLSGAWEKIIVDLSTLTITGPIKVRFVVDENNGTGFDDDRAIDDVVIEETPNCLSPTAGVASSVTFTSADLNWTENGTATSWHIEYGVSGFTQGTGTKITTSSNPYSLTGLTANTDYTWYVRSICGASDTSASSSGTFYTGYCTPNPASTDGSGITNVTFSTVNNTGPTSGGTEPGYGDYSAMVGDIAQNTTVNVDITYSTGYTYVTEIWIDWNDDLDFDDAGENVYSGVSLSANPTTLSASFAVALTAPLGQHRMRIGGADTGPPTTCYTGSWASYEDYTVNVTLPPSCPAPTLGTATSVMANSADLNWTENGTATSWQVEWDVTGFTPGTGNMMITGSNPYNATGLTDNTTYQYRVRAVCAPTDTSTWTTMSSFTTPCATFTAPYTMDFETSTTSTPLCWTQTGVESWLFRNTGTGHIGSVGTINGSTASGGYFAWVDDSSPHNTATTIESPFIDVSGLTSPKLSFYTLSDNEGDVNGNVDFSVDVYDGATWNNNVFFSDTNSLNEAWELINIDLSGFTITGPIQVRFTVDENNGGGFDDDRAIDDITVEETATLVASATVDSNASCNGSSDGGATASATGGASPYSYIWSNAASTASITGLSVGTYTVTITDAFSNTATSSVTVSQPTSMGATITAQSNIACNGNLTGSATATGSGGTGAYTYSWNTGATTATASSLGAGTYTVSITDANGCGPATTTVTITEPAALVASANGTSVSCNGISDGSATASQTGGTSAYTYNWNTGATTATASSLAAGTYSVTITDANGCTDSASYTVTEPAALVASANGTNVSCNGISDGSATASQTGGTSAYTYSWNTGATTATASSLAAGTYSVTITDANGCTDSASVTLTEPTALVASANGTSVSCNGLNDGSATASQTGGTSAYTYSWNTGATTATASSLAAGTYSVTITDANGCTDSASYTVTGPAALVASANGTNVSCNGLSDGSATASQTGGTSAYTYSWNTGATTATASSLAAGTYSVTITDANGCTDSASYTVTEPAALVASANGTNISCNGSSSGSATASQSGGTSAYTYSWNTGATTATASGLAAGTYSVTITDANGCTDSASVTLTEPTNIGASITAQTNVACNGASTGSATAAGSGGTGSYTYAWSNGQTTASASSLSAGTYTVSITDANGCGPATTIVTITESTNLGASITAQTNVDCNGASTGAATAAGSGGTGTYTYAWSNGATTASISGQTAGTYTVSITDANGCGPATTSVTLTEPTAVGASITAQTNVDCNGGSTGSATATGSGGTGSYTYAWSNGATTATASSLVAGTYTVSITDANGCGPATTTVSITESTGLGVSITAQTNVDCNGNSTGAATAAGSGGTGTYTYAWSNGATTATNSGLSTGTYTVSVTDANGCGPATTTVTITEPNALSLNSSATAVSIFGGNDGTINLNVSGGTPTYTYTWSNGATTEDITSLTSGTYTVTVTDANNCTQTTSATVTEPGALSVSSAITNVSCNGSSDGAIDLSVSGGVTPYSYLWSTGASIEDLVNITAGTYTVTVTDANSATSVGNYTVSEPVTLVSASVVDSNVSCNGFTDGGATASATGGTGAYTYLWSNSATTASITGVAAGTYTVTVSDANFCTDVSSVSITEPTGLGATITAQTNVTCNGNATGSATALGSGGTSPYTYAWSNGATTANNSSITAGTYTVSVSDANGCGPATSTVTITEPTALGASITAQTNVTCNGGTTGSATAAGSGGISPYTYAWSNGATAANATVLSSGTYTVSISDANGCGPATTTITITEPASLIAASVVDSNITCNGFADGGATASASGGTMPYTYTWSNSATTASITGVMAGTYTVTVSDANGCTDFNSVTITEPVSLISASVVDSNTTCNGAADGGATASASGGTMPYTYTWSNSATTASITGVMAGTYTVTVSDANGCSDTSSVSITEPASLIAATVIDSNTTCNGAADGGATASASGGTMPYTYMWSNSATTASITGVMAGTYTVTVTDANGCSDTSSLSITEPASLIAASVVDSNTTCNGAADGGATASASGGTMPYTYLWSNSATTASITGVMAGTYTVTVSDANGCSDTSSVSITEPVSLIAASVVDSNTTCNGFADGGATAFATGGTMPYTYTWSNSATTASITGVMAGTYTVTVSDANGCSDTSSVSITEPASLIAASVIDSNTTCNGAADGGATASASGGTMPYTFLWSNSATTASITGVMAGTYTVTVTDANGCSDTSSVSITEPASLIAASVVDSNSTCNGAADGGATASASGGTMPYTFLWSNSATTASITGVMAGTYTVTVSDANGCSDTSSVSITEPVSLIAASVVDSNATCNGAADGGATASASGGTMPYTYTWSNSATTASITGVMAGTYTVTVSDANGCSDTSSVSITEPVSLIAASVVDSNATCNGFANGGATASAAGGTMPYTFLWSNSATTASITGVMAGTYTVTVSDANGCSDTSSVSITEPALLQPAAFVDSNATCNGAADGGATALVIGGTMPYTYLWSNSATTASITGVAAGTYTVDVTDANGCFDTASVSITEPGIIRDTITVNACNSYTWSSNNMTYTMSGTYSDTLTSSASCDSINTLELTITSLDLTVGNFGDSLFANDPAATFQWIDCNNNDTIVPGATSASFAPAQSGTYAVIVSNGSCSDTSACEVVIVIGIKESSRASNFSIFPNPAKDFFTLQTSELLNKNEILRVYNVAGELVLEQNINNTTTNIDMSEFSEGFYFIQFKNKIKKLIVVN